MDSFGVRWPDAFRRTQSEDWATTVPLFSGHDFSSSTFLHPKVPESAYAISRMEQPQPPTYTGVIWPVGEAHRLCDSMSQQILDDLFPGLEE